ncbi:MAG: PAS domain S-box protein [Candidatus Eisenbacteria bacterium]|nr:PAS domain S-box protein [Candidatus Eisenbacteria bacterium]
MVPSGSPELPESRRPQSASQAEILLGHAPFGAALLDLELRYTYINPLLAAINGVPAADHLGRTPGEVIPELAPIVEPNLRRTLETRTPVLGQVIRCEAPGRPGEPRAWSMNCYPLFNEAREVTGVGCAVGDVTERLAAQDILQQSEERLRLVVRATNDAVWDQDLSTRVVWWGEGLATLFGYAPEENALPTSWFYERVHPDDRMRVRMGIRAAVMDGGTRWDDEFGFLKRDGSYARVAGRGTVLRDSSGTPRRMIGALQDITARLLAEERLAAVESRYRVLVEQSMAGIYIIQDGRFAYVNPKLAEIFGTTPGEMVDTLTVGEVVHEEDRAKVLENIRRRVEGETRSAHYSFRIVRRDGQVRVAEVHGSRTIYNGRAAVIGLLMDVTEQRRMEEQLRQTQKMEAVGRLAGGVAHDFNNLLTVISGYSELLLERMGAADPLLHDVEEIRRAAQRAAAMTRQLLAFSRQQVLTPRVLDVGEVVAGMERMLRRLIVEHVVLTCTTGPGLWPVRVDPGQMEQVVLNLALNARDAMSGGGRLTLEAANVDLSEGHPGLRIAAPAGPYVALRVRDTGAGMDPATLEHMFEPFFTTRGPGQGTGLGASTVFGIVEQSGGTLEVESAPGRGTTVTVYLPRCPDPVEPGRGGGDAAVAGGSETILLAEDEEQVRHLAAAVLREAGYAVIESADGDEAFARAAEGLRIDAVVSDVVMPGTGGPELVRRLRASRPGLRALYVSGYSADAVVQGWEPGPGTRALQKPFHTEALVRAVRELLDGPEATA